MPDVAAIQTRMASSRSRFGRIHVPPAERWPDDVATGAIQVQPLTEEHRRDPRAFIAWLIERRYYMRGADDLELRLEHGKVTLATIAFVAALS